MFFNFYSALRFAEKFEVNETVHRILVKAYGLRFIISVSGKAGKFNVVPTLLTIGSGLGLLSVATLVADFFLLYCAKKRKFYHDLKELDYKNPKHVINVIFNFIPKFNVDNFIHKKKYFLQESYPSNANLDQKF